MSKITKTELDEIIEILYEEGKYHEEPTETFNLAINYVIRFGTINQIFEVLESLKTYIKFYYSPDTSDYNSELCKHHKLLSLKQLDLLADRMIESKSYYAMRNFIQDFLKSQEENRKGIKDNITKIENGIDCILDKEDIDIEEILDLIDNTSKYQKGELFEKCDKIIIKNNKDNPKTAMKMIFWGSKHIEEHLKVITNTKPFCWNDRITRDMKESHLLLTEEYFELMEFLLKKGEDFDQVALAKIAMISCPTADAYYKCDDFLNLSEKFNLSNEAYFVFLKKQKRKPAILEYNQFEKEYRNRLIENIKKSL